MVHLLWQEGQLEELAVLEVALRTWGNGLVAAEASGGVAAEVALEQSALRRQRVAVVRLGLVLPRALAVAVLLVLEGEPEILVEHSLTRLVGTHSIRWTEPLLSLHAQEVWWFLHLDLLFYLIGDVILLVIYFLDIFELHIKTLFLTKIRSTVYWALKFVGLDGRFFSPSGFCQAWLGQNRRSFTSFWCLILLWHLWIKELVLLDCWDNIFDIICTHNSIARRNYLWWYIGSIIIIRIILSIKINIWAPLLLIWLRPFGFCMIEIHRSYHWRMVPGAFTTEIWVASIQGTLLIIIKLIHELKFRLENVVEVVLIWVYGNVVVGNHFADVRALKESTLFL